MIEPFLTPDSSLQLVPQWVGWKYVDRAGKPTKVSVNPTFGWNARATDPNTWTTFEEAVAASERYAGVGFVLTEDDPFAGLDLDDCLDEHGNLIWGDDLIASFDTYTEISPSGRGVKLFLRGTKPEHARCKAGGFGPDGNGTVEVYDRARWFAVTGRVWPGSPPRSKTARSNSTRCAAACGPGQTRRPTMFDGRLEPMDEGTE